MVSYAAKNTATSAQIETTFFSEDKDRHCKFLKDKSIALKKNNIWCHKPVKGMKEV